MTGLRPVLGTILVLGLMLAAHGTWTLTKARLAQVLLERAFALELSTGRPQAAWPWADVHPTARIEVPRLGLSKIALEGGSGQALAFGPGHLTGSGEPGTADTAVYAGHRDTHFGFLGDLGRGDLVRVTGADGRQVEYRVTRARVVAWDGFAIDRHPDRPQLDLVTCWPLKAMQSGPMRLVVSAEAVGPAGVAAR